MKVLIVNAGSSSLKYQLINMDDESVIAKGQVQRIGIEGSSLEQKAATGTIVYEEEIPDHVKATELMLKALQDPEKGVITNMAEINAVGHRVLHGGTEFTASTVVDDSVKAAIRRCFPLGPLHNPANLMGIEACEKVMPATPQVAVFDTAFHQTMPPKAYVYGVPLKYLKEHGVRRYGFHGTSHRYVSQRVCEFLGVKPEGQRIIIAHLGNGSSLSAVKDGKCVDTSMGLTPLEGLLMGTRCGSCDPAVVQFIAYTENWTADQVLTMMNKESGLKGVGGYADMRDIEAACARGEENAKLAWDILIYGIKKYIGAYTAAMGGVDTIVFTAGIGEHGPKLREEVMANMDFIGAKVDHEKNFACNGEAVISTDDSKVKICVIPTNEEIMIARDTVALTQK